MAKSAKKGMTRREFVKTAAMGTAALGIAPSIFIPGQSSAASRELKILVWSHFVPRFDKEWYDTYARNWGTANNVTAGIVDVLEGRYDAALSHLEAASPEVPVAMFYRAEALRLKGDTAGAADLYKKVATYNSNGMPYALVRARAMKMAGT